MKMRLWISGLIVIATASVGAQTPPADPTRPPSPAEVRAWFSGGASPEEAAEFELQSVLTGPTRKIAIINGQRLQIGDRLGKARVESIEPRRVVLTVPEGRIELHLDALRNPLN